MAWSDKFARTNYLDSDDAWLAWFISIAMNDAWNERVASVRWLLQISTKLLAVALFASTCSEDILHANFSETTSNSGMP